MTTDIGAVIAGRFRIERNLGSGGMADVFAAHDLATQRAVAVKLLKKEIAQNPEATERLRREGEVLQKLEHPAIVRLETFGKLEDGRLFIAMELLVGETLGQRIRRLGRLDPQDLAPIVAGACSGLHAAHESGIVHRDLKPDNVFLVSAPEEVEVKLLDFGISKVTGSDKLTQTGEVLGTPRYMAPEQLSAERDLDGRTDVYALGVILYEALAGSPPFLAATPTDLIVAILHGKHAPLRSFRPDLSTDIEAIVARCMSRAREARYGSARELAEAFLDVARPAARVSMPGPEPREGMTTAPMGSVGAISGEHPIDGAAEREPKEALRPGTFTELEAAKPPIAPPVEPTAMHTEAQIAPSVPRPRAAVVESPAVSPRPAAATGPYELPTKGKHTWLIVAAMLAGAISAAVAILALKLSANEEEAAVPDAAQPAVAQPVSPAPTPAPAPAEAPPEAPAEDELPEGLLPPDEPDPDEPAADETRQERRRSRSTRDTDRGGTATETIEAATETGAAAPSAADLMRDARAALRSGDPRACVTLVERAMETGASSSALRLRGDCLIRAGDRDEGLRSYERFCLLAPDHPAISEVRALVESLGGRCN